jgi:hypothetical protein
MIEAVKAVHPNTPLTLYANGSGGLLERLGKLLSAAAARDPRPMPCCCCCCCCCHDQQM